MHYLFTTKLKSGKYNVWLYDSDLKKKLKIAQFKTKEEAEKFMAEWVNVYKAKLTNFSKNEKIKNKIWKKVEYEIKREKLEKDYYQGLITAEKLNRLLRELKNKIYTSPELKKKPGFNNKI